MKLFKQRSNSVPNTASSLRRRPVRSAEEWMPKSPISSAKNSVPSKNSFSATNAMVASIDKGIAERKKIRPSGGFVTAEGNRAIDTGRM